VQAQFDRGDEELTKRLWQDVADRDIDLDRVMNLMYTCSFHEDDYEMTKVDESYQKIGLAGWNNNDGQSLTLGSNESVASPQNTLHYFENNDNDEEIIFLTSAGAIGKNTTIITE